MRDLPIVLLAAWFGLAPAAAASPAADVVAVLDAYVHALPPGASSTAGYLSLRNQGGDEHSLVGAESTACEVVELHTQTLEEGVMRMRRVERIALPAGETVRLAPGGRHLMLIGLKDPLIPGGEVALTLIFADGSRSTHAARVRPPGSVDEGQDHHHHH